MKMRYTALGLAAMLAVASPSWADEAAAKLAEASVSVSFSFRCFDLLRWRESERQRERKGKRERERGKQTFECSPRRRKKNSD